MTEQEIVANAKTFWSNNKKVLILAIVGLLLAFGGFVTGRYTTHPQVVEKEKVVTKIQDRIVYQDKIVEKKVYVQVEKKHAHVEITTTKAPDGTTTTKTTEDTDTNTGTNETTDTAETKTRTEVKYVDRIVETEKKVLQQPDWRVYAGAGVAIPTFLGQQQIGVPGLQGFVIQAGADRRILGPFWMGVFANTQGTLGLNLSAVW